MGQWWIATDKLTDGGVKVAGPFSSRDEALNARVDVEANADGVTYWVDQEAGR